MSGQNGLLGIWGEKKAEKQGKSSGERMACLSAERGTTLLFYNILLLGAIIVFGQILIGCYTDMISTETKTKKFLKKQKQIFFPPEAGQRGDITSHIKTNTCTSLCPYGGDDSQS
ncbi:MAG: hypothetical protein PHP74_00085 [Candidatus Gracilibacteria bacterium]|nr:hypothetical protein [Candidatus Gracilibacteria bacterium]